MITVIVRNQSEGLLELADEVAHALVFIDSPQRT